MMENKEIEAGKLKNNSTYGMRKNYSFKGESFIIIPLTWRLGVSRIEALKIRIADWKPTYDRSNQAIFYFDVSTQDAANEILRSFELFDFKGLEDAFDLLFTKDKLGMKNTGQTQEWLLKIIPKLRSEFTHPMA